MARIALAGFIHETNTFSPLPTRYEDFINPGSPTTIFVRGEQILAFKGKRLNNAACGFMDAAEALGHTVIPLLWTATEPANQVTANAFERIMGLIAAGLCDEGPFDAVFLDLHGAMVFEDFQDGETEILRRVRAIAGPVPIVASLDFHGNISHRTIELSSALIGYRTYPHVDIYETGERCARVMQHLLRGKPLYKAFRQVPFLWPISTQSTNTEPCQSIYAEIADVEKEPGMISATIMAGFPPADMPDTGPSVFVYAETQESADAAAGRLYEAILAREDQFVLNLLDAEQAVVRAIQIGAEAARPVVLADVQDNAGGGATSDTPWILNALVRHNAHRAALALMYDPEAAAAAHAAGEGAVVTLGLGGKLTPGQEPVFGSYRVVKLFDGPFVLGGAMFKGHPVNLGKMAQLQIGDVHVVVSSRRTQANDISYFRVVGIEPTEMKILVVKSANHYRADFEPIASAILQVEAPGGIIEGPTRAVYRHLRDGIRLKGCGPVFRKPA